MKKALAISLLVICNTAAVFALSAVSLFIFVIILSTSLIPLILNLAFTILIWLAAVIALGFASSRLLSVFERKYLFNKGRFVLTSYVSPIIGTAIYWIILLSLGSAGHFMGYLDGLAELLYAILLSLTTVAYLISGGIWCSRVISLSSRE